MEGKITLKDLAKMINISTSTISKALNDSPEISKKTKDRVKEIAALHHYRPNRLAQSLKNNKTKTIGVIIPEVLSQFFAMAVHGIETIANKNGYMVIICLSNESLRKEADSLDMMINANVEGVIMSLSKETQSLDDYSHFKNALRYKLPFVLFDRTSEKIECDKISINDELASLEATNYLIKMGRKKIVFLSTISGTSVGEKRKNGYVKEMQNHMFSEIILDINNYKDFETKLLNTIINNKIDGIVAADELSAVSSIKYALKHSFRIPEDISVIGFNNGRLGKSFVPSLTVVDQQAKKQGERAAEILIDRLEMRLMGGIKHEFLETTIIGRDSTLLKSRENK